MPVFLARDLPIRRKQARLGVTIAEASLSQAEWETVYAVTRTYFGVVYARQQLVDFQEVGLGSAAATMLFVIIAVVTAVVITLGRVRPGGEEA